LSEYFLLSENFLFPFQYYFASAPFSYLFTKSS
jgi:hypothetical protein